ncbi:plasmid mobilization protein [Hyphomicrobium nitrativorans]
MVCIRMTDDDYVRKASEAKALGLTVSGLCERLVLTGKVEMSAVPTYRVMDPALFAELRRIGNNVNQLAHALNGNLPPDRGYLWNTAQQLLTMLLSEELLNQKTSSLMTRAIANDSPAPQARDVFQRSVWVHPARRTDDFP